MKSGRWCISKSGLMRIRRTWTGSKLLLPRRIGPLFRVMHSVKAMALSARYFVKADFPFLYFKNRGQTTHIGKKRRTCFCGGLVWLPRPISLTDSLWKYRGEPQASSINFDLWRVHVTCLLWVFQSHNGWIRFPLCNGWPPKIRLSGQPRQLTKPSDSGMLGKSS